MFRSLSRSHKTKLASLSESLAGQSFIQTARVDAWRLSAKSGWWVLLFYNAMSLIGQYFAYTGRIPTLLLLFHGVTFFWLGVTWYMRFLPAGQYIAWPLFACFMIGCHLEAIRIEIAASSPYFLENIAVTFGLILVSTMLVPGPIYYSIAIGVFSVAWTWSALELFPYQSAYLTMTVAIAIGGAIWSAVVVRSVEQMATSSLLMRVTMSPAHVAKQALHKTGVAGGFPVAERKTAVVVIKWSDLAAKSQDLSPIELDSLLLTYFGMVDHLLMKQLSSGAWYVDVIQHEIHVYIFHDVTQPNPEEDAIQFATTLMRERSLKRELDIMGHLDIGMSCGPVVSGIVGPKLYQKTAAIGPATATAIAAKGLGVPLRNAIGGADRVLMDASIARFLVNQEAVRSVCAPRIFEGRKWKDEYIFVLDSRASPEDVAALERTA